MSEIRDLISEHYRGMTTGDLDLAAKSHADDVLVVTPNGEMKGAEAFKAFGKVFMTAVPDQKLVENSYVESGDMAVVEGVYSGTHTGPLQSPNGEIPPTGKSFAFPFADVFVVRDGKIAEHRIYWDNLSFMAQLGLIPS